MKSISCLTSICLVTSVLAITAACNPAAARSNSDQLSVVSSSQLLLAGRGSRPRPAEVEQPPEERHRSVGRGGGWVNGDSHSHDHRSVGRGGSSSSSHSSSHSWGRGGSHSSSHSWRRGGSSASSRHRHRTVGRGGGWVTHEGHYHPQESSRGVFGIFGR